MKLDADELSSLKVKDLQRELKKRGLDTGGLKAALVERLKEHLQQEEAPAEARDSAQEDEKEKEQEQDMTEKEQEKQKKEQQEEPQVDTSDNEKDSAEGEAERAEETADANGAEDGEKPESVSGVKRSADAVEKDEENAPDTKKSKVSKDEEDGSPQPQEDDSAKPASPVDGNADADDAMNAEKAADGATETTAEEQRLTLRIDNFVRPFTLNAVKALVQEFGDFVEDGFWMDAIKTHCYVTYPSSDTAEKTKAALNGKVWPPENGRSLKVEFVDHTAMEVSKFGEASLPSRSKNKGNTSTQPAQRQKVTIDEFFQKTETKPVLYYLPLTDEQVKERKERKSQGPPRKRRHRGGRKRNRRGRFQRR